MDAQNGRQPAPQQTAPPTDPRTRNHSPPTTSGESPGGICRDFIWGICTMGAQCIYRHELEFEAMKTVLKFCHDHQNRTGCTRPDCTYLHTSREEQNLFLATGQIPRVLIDRYTGIPSASAAPAPVTENATSAPPQPHHMMYEYIAQPPPPPPPPPTTTAGAGLLHSPMQGPIMGPLSGTIHGPIPSSMQGPMQGPMPGPMQGPMPGPMQGPNPGPMTGQLHGPMVMPTPMPPIPGPMPPPPPPPPPTSTVSSTRTAGSIFTAPIPTHQNLTSMYHPTVPQTAQPSNALPPMFDPTRPPPPIQQATPCRPLKRAAEENEAGPSKVRKVDLTNDSPCECCVRRLRRIEQLTQQTEQLEQETEQARTELSLKMDNYEKRKQLLRSVFASPDMYRRAEDYVENGSPSPFSPHNEVFNTNIFNSPMTSNTNTSMVQTLLELLLGNSTRGLMESMPSSSVSDDPVDLLSLTARARSNKGSPDILGSILNLLKNVPSVASSSGPSEAELSLAGSSGNGFSRFLDEDDSSPPARARPLPPISQSEGGAGSVPFAQAPRDPGPPLYPPPPPRHYPPQQPASVDPTPHSAPQSFPHLAPQPAPHLAPQPAPHPAQHPAPHPVPHPVPHPGPHPGPHAAAQPAYYPPVHPANAAPPPRPHYAHGHYAPNSFLMANPPYPGAALNQPQRPPMPPQQPQNNPYFMGGRYPNQNYYHPYQ